MSNLNGQAGEVRATISIKRKATGITEIYEVSGTISPESSQSTKVKKDDSITDFIASDLARMFDKRGLE